MFVIDRLLTGGMKFVLGRLAEVVDGELNAEEPLREALLEAQMRRELGEITEEELAEVEADILGRLREIQEKKRGGPAVGSIGRAEAEIVETGDRPYSAVGSADEGARDRPHARAKAAPRPPRKRKAPRRARGKQGPG